MDKISQFITGNRDIELNNLPNSSSSFSDKPPSTKTTKTTKLSNSSNTTNNNQESKLEDVDLDAPKSSFSGLPEIPGLPKIPGMPELGDVNLSEYLQDEIRKIVEENTPETNVVDNNDLPFNWLVVCFAVYYLGYFITTLTVGAQNYNMTQNSPFISLDKEAGDCSDVATSITNSIDYFILTK